MAAGTGVYTGHPEHGTLNRAYQEVAVKCWFTASGKSMPLMIKVKTKEGEVIAIDPVEVVTVEKRWYGGTLNWKYLCRADYGGKRIEFILLFCPTDCSWKMFV